MKKIALFLKWLIAITMTYGSASGSESDGQEITEMAGSNQVDPAGSEQHSWREQVETMGTANASSGSAQAHLPVITSDEAGKVTVTTLIDSDNEWNHLEGNVINLVWYQTRAAGNRGTGSVIVLNAVRQEVIASKHIFKRKLIELAAFQYFIESIDPTNASATSTNLNFEKFELLAAYSYGYGLDDANKTWILVVMNMLVHQRWNEWNFCMRMLLLHPNSFQRTGNNLNRVLEETFNMTQLEKLVMMLVVPAYNRAVDAFMDLLDTLKKDPATLSFLFEQHHTVYAPMPGSPNHHNSPVTGSPDRTNSPMTKLMERILLDFQFQLVRSIAQEMDINLKQSDLAAKTLKKMVDLKTEVLEVENIQIQKQMEQNRIETAKLHSTQKALTDSKPLAQRNLEVAQKTYNAKLNHKASLEKKKREAKCKWYKPKSCLKNLIGKLNGDLRDIKRQLGEINSQLTGHRQHLAQLQAKINNLNSQLNNNKQKSLLLAIKDQLLLNNMAKLSETSVKFGLMQKGMAAAVIKIGGLLSGTATFDYADNLNKALIPIRHVAEKLNDEVKSHVLLVLPQLSPEDKQLIEDNMNKWKTYDHHYTFDIDYYKGAKSDASLTLPHYTVYLTILCSCTHILQMLWK